MKLAVKRTTLKQTIRTLPVTLGSWITLAHPAIGEIMAGFDFDWLTIDMEHSAITLDHAQHLVQVIQLSNVPALIRVGINDANTIKRAMDTGASGVIVPMVNSASDAKNAVCAVKYPPTGTRGVGLARAQGYGMDFEAYKAWVNTESVVVVQIESIEAVNNLEHILSVDGIDSFIVGPYDLSASLGKPGDFDHPDVKEALRRVMEVANRHNVVPGFHVIPPDVAELQKIIDKGYRFIGFSMDILYLGSKVGEELHKARSFVRAPAV